MQAIAFALSVAILLGVSFVIETFAAGLLVAMWPAPDVLLAGILLAVLPQTVAGALAMAVGGGLVAVSDRRRLFRWLAAAVVAVALADASDWLAHSDLADPADARRALVEGCFAILGLALGRSATEGRSRTSTARMSPARQIPAGPRRAGRPDERTAEVTS